jgi:hypothetical protein
LPDEFETLRPRLGKRWHYEDGTKGVIDLKDDGRFEVPVKLFKSSPGIYTIVCWIKTSAPEKAFPATEICIEAD